MNKLYQWRGTPQILTLLTLLLLQCSPYVHAVVDFPVLRCPTFGSVDEARDACQGEFYMWGEPATTFGSGSSKFGNETARFGPYMCTSCPTYFGYVCANATCPSQHVQFSFDRDFNPSMPFSDVDPGLPKCPDLYSNIGSPFSCISLQRHCENNGYGWLTQGMAGDGARGTYSCAACSDGRVDTTVDPNPSTEEPLLFPGMIVMYCIVFLLLALATVVDFISFQQHVRDTQERWRIEQIEVANAPNIKAPTKGEIARDWWNQVVLQFLGAVDGEGKPNTFVRQIFCRNYACGCCSHDDRLDFVTALFLSITVTVLVGGADPLQEVYLFCGFDGEAEELYDVDYALVNHPIPAAYPYQFTDNGFKQYGTLSGGEFAVLLSPDHIVPELVVLLYLHAVTSLAAALVRRGSVPRTPLLAKSISLCAVMVLAVLLLVFSPNSVHPGGFFVPWVLGLIIMLFFLGPLSAGSALWVARCFIWMDVLRLPPPPANAQVETPTSCITKLAPWQRRTLGAVGLLLWLILMEEWVGGSFRAR